MIQEATGHRCLSETASYAAGTGIDYCEADDDGFFWIGGHKGRYETMVNYCPFCGLKAPRNALTQPEWEELKERRNA